MDWFRKHWFDVGGMIAVFLSIFLWAKQDQLSEFQMFLWLHVIALLLHQLEEYRFPGTFPGMLNSSLFHSEIPDRYPLNPNTALYINLSGCLLYFLAAIFGESAIWLVLMTVFISAGNVIAHTLLFNIKGRTVYNAGMVTALLCFIPCIYLFIKINEQQNLLSKEDYWVGVPLGIVANFSIIWVIKHFANRDSNFSFPERNMIRKQSQSN